MTHRTSNLTSKVLVDRLIGCRGGSMVHVDADFPRYEPASQFLHITPPLTVVFAGGVPQPGVGSARWRSG